MFKRQNNNNFLTIERTSIKKSEEHQLKMFVYNLFEIKFAE